MANEHPFPVIRLEVEGMRKAILMALSPEVLSKQIQAEVNAAVERYDFGAAVSQAVNGLLNETIEFFFRYGDGHEEVEKVIRAALLRALVGVPGADAGGREAEKTEGMGESGDGKKETNCADL